MKMVCADAAQEQELRGVLDMRDEGEVLHGGRNRVVALPLLGRRVVAKTFGVSALAGMTGAFRRSKARKSYENALRLLSLGVDTPPPLAYAEERSRSGRLKSACYICGYDDTPSLADALTLYGDVCMEAFADFVASLHQKGILHHDLNNTNVRVRRGADGRFRFSLIDLNRMSFQADGKNLPLRRCFRNVCRFGFLDKSFMTFLDRYLSCRGLSPSLASAAVLVKARHDVRYSRRKAAKKRLRDLFRPSRRK